MDNIQVQIERKGNKNLVRCDRQCPVCRWQGWTNGMRSLRQAGFTVYQKERLAYFGRYFTRRLQHVGIEIRHNGKTKLWDVELEHSFGDGYFKISNTERFTLCGVGDVFDEAHDRMARFYAAHQAEVRIITNIFSKKEVI